MIANSNTLNNAPSRKIDAIVKIYTSENGHYNVYTKSDALQEIAVSRAGEHGKFFGFGVCQQITIKLIDRNKNISISKNQRLQFAFYHFVNGSTEYALSVTDYYVKEVTRDEKTNVITITAYDVLDNAAAHTFSELKMIAPYTIRDVADRVASFLGINLEFPYGDAFQLNFEYGANFNGDETLRAVLNAIAEATQTIYYINNYSKLAFKSLKQSSDIVDLTIYKKDYFELTTADPIGLSYITSTNELGDSATVDIPNGDGVTQYVRDNPFWANRTDLADILSNTVGHVSNLKIAPYNLKWRGNFFTEIGDYIEVEKKDGTFLKTHILHDSLIYNGGLTQTCTWEYNPESDRATVTNPITIGEKLNQTFARVDKVNKRIDLVASEVSDNKSEIAEIKLTTDDIILRVEKVENQEFDLDITDDENFINLSERVGALEVSDTEIIASVSETKTTLQGYTDAAVSDIRDQLNSETASMRSTVTAVTQAMAALQIQTGEIEASVSDLESSTASNLNDAVSGLTADLGELEASLRAEYEAADEILNDALTGEVTAVREDISSLNVKADGITASVSSLQKITEQTAESVETEIAALAKEVNLKVDSKAVSISIEKALSAGVDKVVTSAKEYTFDDTGLNISSSDSEFSTQITEDGMKIYKGTTEVLTADNAGVQARDLHARTFLIIGENSRLEDRGNRTACFWIGPAGG